MAGFSTIDESARGTWGDPFRACGLVWSISASTAANLRSAIPERCTRSLDGRNGAERQPEHSWPAVAYVGHVSDNLRIWAERMAGVEPGTEPKIASASSAP
jgi:hypothetical protein